MNADECLEAGRELDALMAEKAMRWHKFNEDGIPCWCFTRTKATHPDQTDSWLARFPDESTGWTFGDVKRKDTRWISEGVAWKGIWRPSQNIVAAWAVVEKLHSPDAYIKLETGTRDGQSVWWCVFIIGDGRDDCAAGDTPQLAICRAALWVCT